MRLPMRDSVSIEPKVAAPRSTNFSAATMPLSTGFSIAATAVTESATRASNNALKR